MKTTRSSDHTAKAHPPFQRQNQRKSSSDASEKKGDEHPPAAEIKTRDRILDTWTIVVWPNT
jgi:hypothetical protein